MSFSQLFPLLKHAFSAWQQDKASLWSAALAYDTLFSLSPLLLVLISIAGMVFGKSAVEGRLYYQLQGIFGADAAHFLQGMVQHSSRTGSSVIVTIVGVVAILFGAAGVFGQLEEMLNHIWHVDSKKQSGIWNMIKEKAATFFMVVLTGVLLTSSFLLSAVLSVASAFLHILPFSSFLVQAINNGVSFVIITILFALLYRFLPSIHIPWKNVWVGAAVTSLLFVIGKIAIGLYIGHSSFSSTYGAAASLVIILVWLYYASQILFFGAEITKVYTLQFDPESMKKIKQHGKRVHPLARLSGLVVTGFVDEMGKKANEKKKTNKKR